MNEEGTNGCEEQECSSKDGAVERFLGIKTFCLESNCKYGADVKTASVKKASVLVGTAPPSLFYESFTYGSDTSQHFDRGLRSSSHALSHNYRLSSFPHNCESPCPKVD